MGFQVADQLDGDVYSVLPKFILPLPGLVPIRQFMQSEAAPV